MGLPNQQRSETRFEHLSSDDHLWSLKNPRQLTSFFPRAGHVEIPSVREVPQHVEIPRKCSQMVSNKSKPVKPSPNQEQISVPMWLGLISFTSTSGWRRMFRTVSGWNLQLQHASASDARPGLVPGTIHLFLRENPRPGPP